MEINITKERWKASYEDAMRNCTMLYCGRHKSMMKSLMCFGWECPDSWNEFLKDLSYKLEALNITYYPKYRTRIEAVQVKEKYGTLRFYYDVHVDAPWITSFISDFLENIHEKLMRNVNYKYKSVVDTPRYVSHEVEEIQKAEYDAHLSRKYKISNVDYSESNGKYFKIMHLEHCAVMHQEPTEHRLVYRIAKTCLKLSNLLDFSKYWNQSKKQFVIAEYMNELAKQYVRDAEHKSANICAICGSETGHDEKHPTCWTTGWVTALCSRCAEESGKNYWIDGKIYNNGKLVEQDEKSKDY